jgi:hypothetical protein
LNTRVVLLMGEQTAASDHNTQAILKMVVIPLVGGGGLFGHMRRLEIAATILIPVGCIVK